MMHDLMLITLKWIFKNLSRHTGSPLGLRGEVHGAVARCGRDELKKCRAALGLRCRRMGAGVVKNSGGVLGSGGVVSAPPGDGDARLGRRH